MRDHLPRRHHRSTFSISPCNFTIPPDLKLFNNSPVFTSVEKKAGAWSGGEEDPRMPDDGASSLAVMRPSDPPVNAGLHTSFALSFTTLVRCVVRSFVKVEE